MTQPTNPMTELKAKDCPLCGSAPITRKNENDGGIFRIRCSNVLCNVHQMWFPPDKWNTRPREGALEGALLKAKDGLGNAVMFIHNIATGLNGETYVQGCKDKTMARITAINSVLGKGGE